MAHLPAITILCLWGKVPSHLLKALTSEMWPASEKSPAWIRMSPSGMLMFDVWLWVSLIHTTLKWSLLLKLSFFNDLVKRTISVVKYESCLCIIFLTYFKSHSKTFKSLSLFANPIFCKNRIKQDLFVNLLHALFGSWVKEWTSILTLSLPMFSLVNL